MRFEALTVASVSALVAARFSSPLYAQDWVVATGMGKLVLGDRGYDINSYDLDDGNLTVRAANLLAFDTRLDLKQSIVPGFLTLIGTGKFLASANGPVIFADPPIRVDPEALVGWADCPSPSYHYDGQWMAQNLVGLLRGAVGVQSGEERQFDFTGAGTVLIQSSEKTLADPAAVRMMEQQLTALSQAEKQHLHRFLGAQLAQ